MRTGTVSDQTRAFIKSDGSGASGSMWSLVEKESRVLLKNSYVL